MNPPQPFTDHLQAATDTARARLAGLLAAGPRRGPAGEPPLMEALAGALVAIHAAIAPLALPPGHPAVAASWPPYAALAAPLIERSGAAPAPLARLPDELALRALVIGWLAQHRTRAQPAALLGALYALAELLRMLPGPPAGVGEPPALAWEALVASLDSAPLDAAERAQVVAVAQEVAGELVGLLVALDPPARRPFSQLAGVLNPAAGKHAIPSDLAEIRAAVRAGERSWAAHPYYRLRYAARGIRYTWSDSAWLVTLCDLPQAEVDHQVAWLGRLLATRGMPRWLLEHHLELIHAELVAALPARAGRYAPLAAAAARLRAQRLAHVPESLGAELAAAFDAMVGPALAQQLPGAAQLIVAAIADDRAQLPGALSSLVGWLTDPAQFPPPWIAAVRRLVQLAQEGEPR